MKVKIFKCSINDDLEIPKFEKNIGNFLSQIAQEAALQGCIIAPLLLSTTTGDGMIIHIVHYNYQRLQSSGKIL